MVCQDRTDGRASRGEAGYGSHHQKGVLGPAGNHGGSGRLRGALKLEILHPPVRRRAPVSGALVEKQDLLVCGCTSDV